MAMKHDVLVIMFSCICLFATNISLAGNTFYKQDFETGTVLVDEANPVWSLPANFGEKLGEGNLFEVVSETAHSGKYSLRFNYDGRNDICNMCGGTYRIQNVDHNGVDYFVDSEHIDLAFDPILASTGRYFYDIDDGFSKWNIQSVLSESAANDRLELSLIKKGIGTARNIINSGDRVYIARQCGVDGLVGGDIDRRSDCDIAISYFAGIEQQPGESVYRRIYIKYSLGTIIPTTQKLRYWYTSDGRLVNIKIGLRAVWGPEPVLYITGLSTVGSGGLYLESTGITVLPNIWYYLEEQIKAESSDLANDGEYRLWFSEAGKENIVPVIEYTGLDLPVLKNTSLWGNHQHDFDTHGFWYFDDIEIANMKLGPVNGDTVAPPSPPILY